VNLREQVKHSNVRLLCPSCPRCEASDDFVGVPVDVAAGCTSGLSSEAFDEFGTVAPSLGLRCSSSDVFEELAAGAASVALLCPPCASLWLLDQVAVVAVVVVVGVSVGLLYPFDPCFEVSDKFRAASAYVGPRFPSCPSLEVHIDVNDAESVCLE